MWIVDTTCRCDFVLSYLATLVWGSVAQGEKGTTMLKRCGDSLRNDRGDVPGWVLITIMTAGLVVAIWALAAPALGTVFDQAINRVISF
jgi:hypothetical protein